MFSDDGKTLLIFDNFEKLNRKLKEEYIQIKASDSLTINTAPNNIYFSGETLPRRGVHPLKTFSHQIKQGAVTLFKRLVDNLNVFYNPVKFIKLLRLKERRLDKETLAKQLKNIEHLLETAECANQTSFIETLRKEKARIEREMELVNHRLFLFLEESDIIQFARKFKKDVKLTWIKNYNRPMPADVYLTIADVERRQLFDNYVILHIDVEGKNIALTEKEKEKMRDPILFGALERSRRLYPIADWVDEHCDLTLSQMLQTIDFSQGG